MESEAYGRILESNVEENDRVLERLSIRDETGFLKHESYSLLLNSMLCKYTFLARTVPPVRMLPIARAFDEKTGKLLRRLIVTRGEWDDDDDHERAMEQPDNDLLSRDMKDWLTQQFRAKLSKGGYGLRSLEDMLVPAFFASLAVSAKTLHSVVSERFPGQARPQTPSTANIEVVTESIRERLREARADSKDLLPPQDRTSARAFISFYCTAGLAVAQKRFQHALQTAISRETEIGPVPHVSARHQAAFSSAVRMPEASRWLQMLPDSDHTTLSDEEWTMAARQRSMLDIEAGSFEIRCPLCEAEGSLKNDPFHALNCAMMSGMRTKRHDMVKSELQTLGKTAGVQVELEPTHIGLEGNKDRGDVLFHVGMRPILTDVTVVRSMAPSTIRRRAARVDGLGVPIAWAIGVSVSEKEKEKTQHYVPIAQQHQCTFTPSGFDTMGGFGAGAVALFQQLEEAAAANQRPQPKRIIARAKCRVAAAIQRGNCKIVGEWRRQLISQGVRKGGDLALRWRQRNQQQQQQQQRIRRP